MNGTKFKETILPLTQKIYPMIFRMLGDVEDANDAIQEVMIKLWNQRKKLAQHPNITGFVVLTARNHCLDLLKKRKPQMVDSDDSINPESTYRTNQEVEYQELNAIIGELLKELPEQQREVLVLRDLDGFEFAEIAELTGLTRDHIRVVLSRARKQISSKLKTIYSYEKR
ncbi:MAG: RNA polymerase subunit sigma-24 [Rickettsiales bacterium]|nr:RNA polymerase subunit sigma-24 [Rickettsiales bacterium]